MKKIISIIVLLAFALFTGCAQPRNIPVQNKTTNEIKTINVQPYGVACQERKVDGVKYQVSVGGVVLACIFCETIVVPVVVIGWFLYEPISAE